tara:strand:- start:81 stop:398 length:318 start_codon:yes stop_codon:yes gene_type:complete
MQQAAVDVGGPMLQGPMQHAAFTVPMPIQELPSLGIQRMVDPGPAWLTGQHAPTLNGQQQVVPSAHSMQGKAKEKTQLCSNFSTGGCRFGDRCSFAHGTAELRVR